MFETSFAAGGRRTRLLLPFRLDGALEDWAALRSVMVKQKPDAFTRDEWAYLIGFLDREFSTASSARPSATANRSRRPAPRGRAPGRHGGRVAAQQRQPARAAHTDPAEPHRQRRPDQGRLARRRPDPPLFDYASTHLRPGELRDHLARNITVEVFSREDARNAAWASSARTRIAFGSTPASPRFRRCPIPPTASASPSDTASRRPGSSPPPATTRRSSRCCGSSPSTGRPPARRRAASCSWTRRAGGARSSRPAARDLEEDLPARARGRGGLGEHPRPPVGLRGGLGQSPGRGTWRGDRRRRCRHGSPAGQRILPLTAMTTAEALARLPERIQTIGHVLSPEPRASCRPGSRPAASSGSFPSLRCIASARSGTERISGGRLSRWWRRRDPGPRVQRLLVGCARRHRRGPGVLRAGRRGATRGARALRVGGVPVPLGQAPDPWRLAESGFAQVDTQLRFRIALNRLTGTPSAASLPVRFANGAPFVLRPEELPVFPHERFRHLPGAHRREVTRRYALWASSLSRARPNGASRWANPTLRRAGFSPSRKRGTFTSRWRCCTATRRSRASISMPRP